MRNKALLLALAPLAMLSLAPRLARAELDAFGTGDGHSGAFTASAANQVVNVYASLTADVAAGGTTITFGTPTGDAAGFAAGDLVVVWRATGLDEADAPSAAQGRIDLATVSGGAVGRYELARVQTVAGQTLTLTKPLVRGFARDVSQVVKIPEYTTVDVPAGTSLTATSWTRSGASGQGGILAFLATGAVTVGGALDVSRRGFRGGSGVQAGSGAFCTANDGPTNDGFAAKGEGVVFSRFGAPAHGGRGNRANGGGGGNCQGNGGGGGGNFGAGGQGGNAILTNARAGIPGAALDYSLTERMTFGGGGGAGEQQYGLGSGGGEGGGVLFVRALSLGGAGALRADGNPAGNSSAVGLNSDGAGGGGAGGSMLVRVVRNLDCGLAATRGGGGGDSVTIGLSAFGPGGGGGGGRILIQSEGGTCPTNVSAGTAGDNGVSTRGAGPASPNAPTALGTVEPTRPGPYCYSNPTTDPQCTGTAPVCDVATGTCNGCNGGFGSGATSACAQPVAPVCAGTGACVPCQSDLGLPGGNDSCQTATSPYCFTAGGTTGQCGKCTTNADCAGPSHPGPVCNPTVGSCGTACGGDGDCKTGEWCSQSVCVPKTPNGQPLPPTAPINGECTVPNGARVCVSTVCEADDDLCGLKNDKPCDGAGKCRSSICFTDGRCGKPNGEPCNGNIDCRSDLCKNGTCQAQPCATDADCKPGTVCDPVKKECVAGCKSDNDCVKPKICSANDGGVGQCVEPGDGGVGDGGDGGNGNRDGGNGNGNGNGDGGNAFDTSGSIEGGGCSCDTSGAPSTTAFGGLVASMVACAAFVRRRRR